MIMSQLKNFIPAPIKARIKVGHYASKLTQRIRQLEKENEKVFIRFGGALDGDCSDDIM